MDFDYLKEDPNKEFDIDNAKGWQNKCHDCGKFVSKDRWIPINDPRNASPLCAECAWQYDDPRTI